jgi:putative transposase
MTNDALARPERWARFRFSVIGGLLASPPEGGALQDALRALAARPYQHPFTGERIRFGFSTLERWYYQAKETADPLAALGRKVRADTGRTWALAPALLALLAAQYQRYPRWTVQLHYDNLAAEVAKQPALDAELPNGAAADAGAGLGPPEEARPPDGRPAAGGSPPRGARGPQLRGPRGPRALAL